MRPALVPVLLFLAREKTMAPNSAAVGAVERELKEQVRKLQAENRELSQKLSRVETPSGPLADDLGLGALTVKKLTSLLFFLGCLSATAIILESWAETLSKEVELSFFIPLMIGHGGNTGGSVVGSTIAALAAKGDENVSYLHTLGREVVCASVVGVAFASLASLVLPLVGISRHTSTVVTCTIFAVTILSTVVGATLPFALKALKLDAAAYGPPAVTTLIDAMGLITYLVIADFVLKFFLNAS
mmetsp:Transcript_29810/g.96170  ORF Transcript_29810/g.96170 Transcript_29810/m.96170 type:complete len:244 (+) Transcript_29810:1559-2290(+)